MHLAKSNREEEPGLREAPGPHGKSAVLLPGPGVRTLRSCVRHELHAGEKPLAVAEV